MTFIVPAAIAPSKDQTQRFTGAVPRRSIASLRAIP
jgi:hypothetical protein